MPDKRDVLLNLGWSAELADALLGGFADTPVEEPLREERALESAGSFDLPNAEIERFSTSSGTELVVSKK